MSSALWKTRRSKSDFQIGRPSSLQNTHTGTSFQPLASVSSARRTRSVSSVSPSSSDRSTRRISPFFGSSIRPPSTRLRRNLDEPAMHVDVAPLQTEELSEAHPGAQRTEQQGKVGALSIVARNM